VRQYVEQSEQSDARVTLVPRLIGETEAAKQAKGTSSRRVSRKLTAEGIAEAREDGDTIDTLLERMGFELSAARRARVTFLVHRGEVEPFGGGDQR
jgi:hypothetical protein